MAIDSSATSNIFTVGAGATPILTTGSSLIKASGVPSFAAWKSSGTTTASSAIIFNTVNFNVGSYYNSTTGVFTCTVAGLYYFRAQILVEKTVGDWRAYLVATGKQQRQTIFYQGVTTWFNALSVEGVYNMSAGDTIYATFTGPASLTTASTSNNFTGHMII